MRNTTKDPFMFHKTLALSALFVAFHLSGCAEVAEEISKNVVCNGYCNTTLECDDTYNKAQSCEFKEPLQQLVRECVTACENILDQGTTYDTDAVRGCWTCTRDVLELNTNICASDTLTQRIRERCSTECADNTNYKEFYTSFEKSFSPEDTCGQ